MKLFAISDLHLPGPENKDMGVFGPKWQGYVEKIKHNWSQVVGENDLVLCPGDISWAMKLEDMGPDFDYLARLPGKIVLVKGNHDYWWQSLRKVRESLPDNVYALQNDHFPLNSEIAVCGTRGWVVPGHPEFEGEADEKVYRRELIRLELSIESALKAGLRPEIVMLHYPPAVYSQTEEAPESGFVEIMMRYGVKTCVYGHLHNGDAGGICGRLGGIEYQLVACDAVDFRPVLLRDL